MVNSPAVTNDFLFHFSFADRLREMVEREEIVSLIVTAVHGR